MTATKRNTTSSVLFVICGLAAIATVMLIAYGMATWHGYTGGTYVASNGVVSYTPIMDNYPPLWFFMTLAGLICVASGTGIAGAAKLG